MATRHDADVVVNDSVLGHHLPLVSRSGTCGHRRYGRSFRRTLCDRWLRWQIVAFETITSASGRVELVWPVISKFGRRRSLCVRRQRSRPCERLPVTSGVARSCELTPPSTSFLARRIPRPQARDAASGARRGSSTPAIHESWPRRLRGSGASGRRRMEPTVTSQDHHDRTT
jgi:hypothetical protein